MTVVGECTPWPKYLDKAGYGRIRYKGKRRLVHRVVYVEHHGLKIEDIEGMLVMHACDNPPCVNPSHLFLGTARDNMLDKVRKGRHSNGNDRKTHCKRGHPLEGDNLYLIPSTGARVCRSCKRAGR